MCVFSHILLFHVKETWARKDVFFLFHFVPHRSEERNFFVRYQTQYASHIRDAKSLSRGKEREVKKIIVKRFFDKAAKDVYASV